MRVIAGSAGGITLKTPKTELRPTMDLVRGAVFSSLGEAIVGATVLDLFAGTGSIGIEALSRGAASATMVELDKKACGIIAENLERARLQARIVCHDVFRFLASHHQAGPVDYVFADPPYSKRPQDRDFSTELLQNPHLASLLREGGLLILEVARNWTLPEDTSWNCLRRKRYGSTETLFLRRESVDPFDPPQEQSGTSASEPPE
jgi:16S rRNA (guanine966-N2)-methyltransferase